MNSLAYKLGQWLKRCVSLCNRPLGRCAAGFVCGVIWWVGANAFLSGWAVVFSGWVCFLIIFEEIGTYNEVYKHYPKDGDKNAHSQFWWGFLQRCLGSWVLLLLLQEWGLGITAFLTFMLIKSRRPPAEIVLEGEDIKTSAKSVKVILDQKRAVDDEGFPFGGVRIPMEEATKNTLIIGAVGSGKSVLMKWMLSEILTSINQGVDQRIVLNDPAGEMPAMLEAMHIEGVEVILTDPFDQRCRPLALNLLIQTPTDAHALAEILVPEKKGSKNDAFWRNVTILIVKAVVRYFCKNAPYTWTLRDVLLALRDPAFIDLLLADEPELKHYEAYKGSDNTTANIFSTIVTTMDVYESIAALWHKSETVYGNQPFDLKEDFLEKKAVMVMANSETAKQPLQNINRILLTRLIQMMIDGAEHKEPSVWFFLDELPSIGYVELLMSGMTRLRKYGGAFVAIIQSLTQLTEKYGQEDTNSITSQFNHKAILRLSDPATSKWIGEIAGNLRTLRRTESETINWSSGRSKTTGQQFEEKQVIRPGVFTEIPLFEPNQGVGLKGLFFSGSHRWWHTYPASIVKELPPRGDKTRNKLKMPREYQFLEPWTKADYERLNITHLMQDSSINIRDILNRGYDDQDI